jgi:O-antigen/teichoic acid export membrane protein
VFNSDQHKKQIYYLFTSNIITFALIGVSYVAYSKLLKPSEFGLYSIALTISNFGTMLLDGGLRNTIIKLPTDLKKEQEEVLLFVMLSSSFFLCIASVLTSLAWGKVVSIEWSDQMFVMTFIIIYLLSYPFVSICTAQIERQLNYVAISWIESVTNIIERAAPAILMLSFNFGINSFVLALLIGRVLRVVCLLKHHFVSVRLPSISQVQSILHLLKEGFWLQLATALSLIRDNMPVIVVGTMFGKTWVGYYTWALQLCAVSSQLFVQIAARISLPLMSRASDNSQKVSSCLTQIRLLTIATAPVLIIVLTTIPSINSTLFQGKWSTAIGILPLLFMRMVPGLATTPLGSMLMINRGGKNLAKANMLWTMAEVFGAVSLSFAIGPTGLAWSYAILVWVGLVIFILYIAGVSGGWSLSRNILTALLLRPSIMTAGLLCTLLYYYTESFHLDLISHPQLIASLPVILLFSYFSEQDFRYVLKSKI